MSVPNDVFTLKVECYSGYRGEELPRRLFLNQREIRVKEILDRWLAPDHRYFKLSGENGNVYIVRHDVASGRWELAMFAET